MSLGRVVETELSLAYKYQLFTQSKVQIKI